MHAEIDDLVETFSRLVHELKTPLAALRALAQGLGYEPVIMADPAAREVAADYTGRMVSEVDRLVRLLDSFKCLSKPRHRGNPHTDLRRLVSTTLFDAFSNRASEKGIRFRIRSLEDIFVPADPDQVLQILTNLVENAMRATPTGGQVTVGMQRSGDIAQLIIEDTGCGLSDEVFAALEAGRPPASPSGTGIGLLVVRAILAARDGRIKFERRASVGTRVIVELPADPTSTPSGTGSTPS